MTKSLLSISKLANVQTPRIPGYFVISTAPINVEGDTLPAHRKQIQVCQQRTAQQEEQTLNHIAELLYQKVSDLSETKSNAECIELVISTNGFSNSVQATQQRFEEVYNYINTDNSSQMQNRAKNLMFIGYRWPSEPLMGAGSWWWEKLLNAVTALPILPRVILLFGTISILISVFFKPFSLSILTFFSFVVSIITLILTTLFFFVISLIFLRLFVYFRDYYRATNFGVPDLVELIRQLDKALVSKAKEQYVLNVGLIAKLSCLLLKKLEHKLASQGVFVTKQDELVLKVICERVVKDYCKDKSFEKIRFEDLNTQGFESSSQFTKQEDIDALLKLAHKTLKQDTEPELIRLRERAIEILENKAKKYWEDKNRIKLTFIGHSMGAYVVTSVIRILSDVFDLNSVGTLELSDKLPSSNIGRVFSLERLVLVAPDIPIITILSGRANFLRSSLRRFKEAYLFSNEGDLALRLASTVANYFSFPARTRESGYRLGNVAINNNQGYGISRVESVQQEERSGLLNHLTIDSFNKQDSLAKLQNTYQLDETEDREQIAKLFTYFDCTDYTDETIGRNSRKRRVLTLQKWRWEPRWIYYLRLIVAYGLGIKDTHGGYFHGQFSQQVIYRLAFLGFCGFLDSLKQENRTSALNYLSQECLQKRIQVILSPERYQVDILERDRQQVRREMLNP